MLSILIPVYNYQVVQLVTSLQKQCEAEAIQYEIIVLDDTSTTCVGENKAISNLDNCQFVHAKKHLGRAKIRNKLATLAQGAHLLFIDADAIVESLDFIHKYVSSCQKADVVVGGVKYSEHPPKRNALRWYYGTRRECIKASERNKHPYQSIVSFNILIAKSVFQEIEFNENSIDTQNSAYGHEDTLLGLELKKHDVRILHIDNFLIHEYGETDEKFLKNSLIAVEKYVSNALFQKKEVVNSIKIFRVFKRFEKFHLIGMLNVLYTLFGRSMVNHLLKPNPSLKIFDFYRLSYMAHFYKKQK